MILIAVVGLAFVVGMPYLLDNSTSLPSTSKSIPDVFKFNMANAINSVDPEMKKEFEEQQKKSVLSGGANTANPLQNFDMAAWMAGKTAGASGQASNEGSGGSGSNVRRRG